MQTAKSISQKRLGIVQSLSNLDLIGNKYSILSTMYIIFQKCANKQHNPLSVSLIINNGREFISLKFKKIWEMVFNYFYLTCVV